MADDTQTQIKPPAKPRRSREHLAAEKRETMLRAAERVFARRGYDGASMSDIAAEAGVSKPTLYVHFDSKEKLFDALIEDMACNVPEGLLALDANDPDMEEQLVRAGIALMHRILKPERQEMLRVVIGAAGQFPDVGRKFFEAGPGRGLAILSAYLSEASAAGRLRVPDTDLGSHQLLELIQSKHLRRMLFAVAPRPADAEIERSVRAGVGAFLRAYAP